MHFGAPRRFGAALAVLVVLAASALVGLGLPASAAAASQQWQLVAQDQFNGALAPHWSVYQGSPACCRGTTWATSQVAERDGRLVLTATRRNGQWIAGGLSAAGWPAMVRTYGKYVARVRVDRGAGISAVALLWPKSNVWPPEIDYYELSAQDADRTQETQTVHRAVDDAQLRSVYQGDLTQWHTVSVEWLPNSISYFVDNKLTGRVTDPAYIPHQPMWPAFQMQIQQNAAGQAIAAAAGSVSMYVDWFAVYAPVTATTPTTPTATTTPTAPTASTAPATATTPAPATSTAPVAAPPTGANSGSFLWIVLAVLLLLALGWLLVARLLRRRSRH